MRLPEVLLDVTHKPAEALGLSRAEYIRRALECMNRETRTTTRAKRLAEVSRRVRKENMRVNAEFAAIEAETDA